VLLWRKKPNLPKIHVRFAYIPVLMAARAHILERKRKLSGES
jgi:hypothetical protein